MSLDKNITAQSIKLPLLYSMSFKKKLRRRRVHDGSVNILEIANLKLRKEVVNINAFTIFLSNHQRLINMR